MIHAIYNFLQDPPVLGLFLLPLIIAAIVGCLLGFSLGGMAHALGYDSHFWALVRWTPAVCCAVAFAGSFFLWLLSHTLHM